MNNKWAGWNQSNTIIIIIISIIIIIIIIIIIKHLSRASELSLAIHFKKTVDS